MNADRLIVLAETLERDAELLDHDPAALYIVPTEHLPVEIIRLTRSRFKARLGIHASIRMREVAAELRAMAAVTDR